MGYSGARVAELSLQTSSGPRSLFLKVIAPGPLPEGATEAERLKRQGSLKSYANECTFLTDPRFIQKLQSRGVRTPEILKVEVEAEASFVTLQECMTQDCVLLPVHPAARTPEVLHWLARFHGSFHGAVPSEHGLWEVGSHVHLDKRPPGELDKLPANVTNFCEAFAGEYAFFARPELRQVGARLQAVTRGVADHLRPGEHNKSHVTLVHGDFKGANYFLKREGGGVAGFDWQWTGPGIGATDLIYLFATGVEDSVVDDYLASLRTYHQSLEIPSEAYPFEALLSDFKVATLDYARWAFCYRLAGDTPEKYRQRAEKVDMNMGYFRRHPPRMQWLLQRVEEYLPEAESSRLFFRGGVGQAPVDSEPGAS